MKPTGSDRDPGFDRLIARGLAREVDASGNACPDADLLAAWFDHTLSSPESERIEAHLAGCECCQQILGALARSEPEVIRAAPLPAPARAWHWHWRWVVPLATAALVVVVATRTLRAPGPATRLRPSGYGEAGSQTTAAASPQPAQVATNRAAPTKAPSELVRSASDTVRFVPPPGADLKARGTMAGRTGQAPPPPPSSPARADAAPNAAPIAAPPAAAAPQAMKPESQMAELAGRKADAARDKMLMTAVSKPAEPAVAESAAAGGRAAAGRATGLQAVRPVSVAAPAVAGSTIAWRFGQDGAIERSSDRGQTWERQSSGVTTALADASAPNDRVCWIVGARGVVLRSTDGRTWQRLNPPTDADLVAVHAWNELSATVTAADRSEYETTDAGKTWRRR